ncbi:NepR family anti-sigma factor [Erythrobacter tepidarius]|uniref:NepR family anti-sigma factor n=1 Tax=Erythrobacter tepidarius TaxID=60454 RepID=UPI000A372F0D|nr:NepR family anti-sigma factor [Erythrobacter tepidarius]
MASDRKPPSAGGKQAQRVPAWADGLKQLYDSVVEEDLPDSFKTLLARLDELDPRRLGDGLAGGGRASPSPDDREAQT